MSGSSQSWEPLFLEGFSGLNTNASRPAIKDTEMAWCDGWMPIGDSQLRTIPGVGAPIFTSAPDTISFFDFFNFGGTACCLIFLSTGAIWIYNFVTNVSNQLAPAGTIGQPSQQNVGVTQWGNDFAIIVAAQPNGYFFTDGNVFYSAGSIAPPTPDTITSGGSGYTSTPSYTVYGGSGSGVTVSPVIQGGTIVNLVITNPGAGYVAGDIPQVAFSGGGSDTTPILTATSSGSALTSINIVNGGTGFTSAPTLTIVPTGGGGTGATATCTVSGGVINTVTLTNGGTGYLTAPAVEVSPGFNNAAYVILAVVPDGISGTAVETYQSRVWIAFAGEMLFSAPQSYTDFSVGAGGGSFRSADSFLRVSYIKPIQTNGFLYLIADSSINYISNVTSSGDPVTTSFTNQNANPEVGTPYANAIDVLGSNIVFANAFGAHVSYGGNATKISEPLDGVYNSIANFGGEQLSSAKHILFGKRVWVLLVPVIDQITGSPVNKLFMWDEKKWWTTNQNANITYIASQEINSVISAYGSDGTSVYPLFTTPTTAFTKIVRSKLWAKPGGYMAPKSSNRVWLVAQYTTAASPNITFSVDNETGTQGVTLTPPSSGLTTGFYVSPPTAVGQNGNLLGMTLSTVEGDVTLISAAIDAVPVGFRG